MPEETNISQQNINAILNQKTDPSKLSDKIDKKEEHDEGRLSLAQDFDTFLKLLTTQLKYQNPTDPMDTKDFTNQIVLFSQVEQQINLNKKLNDMLERSDASLRSSATNYLGTDIVVKGSGFSLENGSAKFDYDLDREARVAMLTIRDSDGMKVYETLVPKASGRHAYVWDGNTSHGNKAEDGEYTFQVSAVDGEKDNVPVTHITSRKVTGVRYTEGNIQLESGDSLWNLQDIISLRS